MSERIGRYLMAALLPDRPRHKTHRWIIVSSSQETVLGYIAWYRPWRQYTFDPEEDTTFNADCLVSIKSFLDCCNGKAGA